VIQRGDLWLDEDEKHHVEDTKPDSNLLPLNNWRVGIELLCGLENSEQKEKEGGRTGF
jgi:hypothetical protein